MSAAKWRLLSFIGLLACWQAIVVIWQPDMLPSPVEVALRVWQEAAHGDLLANLFATTKRVGFSFILAMLLGVPLGLWMAYCRRADLLLDGIVTVFMNIPALVVIILCFLWLGLNELATVMAVVINKIPVIVVTMREGGKSIDFKLMAVAKAFHISRWRTLVDVYLPQLYPYLLAATRAGLALVWKIVLVAELLGCSDGVGFQLGIYFQYFDIPGILAYTFAFVGIVILLEAGCIRRWEISVMRWRQ
ncbi:ABC transporter permease [Zhongshania sp. BJYM1]|uniref:ABC transporter permease n=1 Tax=Zhongshania aquatica TaxID=2965069 RepID=UPI0022B30C1D|nr:ABC transporter permease subunit [Marortus sp. BJYM1]